MHTLNVLAFDLGASSGRAMLGKFDGKKIQIHPVHAFSNGPVGVAGHYYWDTLRLFSEIRDGIAAATRESEGSLSGIGIDTWGVDYGLLDADGELLGNPYYYRDERTSGMFEEAFKRMPEDQIFNWTGLAFQPFNTLFQLLAMKIQKPHLLEQAATLLFMPDLLSYSLTGEKATEYTIASTSQLTDARSRSWSSDVRQAMEFPGQLFTLIQEPGTVRGKLLPAISDELRTDRIPVIGVASHDTASAVVAVPTEGETSAYLSSGTWSLLGVEVDDPVLSRSVREWNLTNEGGFGGKYRLLRNVMGLWIVQECKRVWDNEGGVVGFDDLVELSRKSKPFTAIIDPDDPLFYSRGNMPLQIAEYCRKTGQTAPQSRGEIVRTVYESLALRYRWTVEKLESITGKRIEKLYIVGGGVKNILLNQFAANALKRTVVGGYSEAAALGNLLVQAHALGELQGLSEIRQVARASFPTTAYEPSDGQAWDDAYQRFLTLLEASPT
ncbi:MAG: rhamnulokinase [Bacteroidetes bacterium]|nr:rhamnulokinase [Bacteroidota bacterium]